MSSPFLAEAGVIPSDLARRLVVMAKFRNVLVHLYLEVDLTRGADSPSCPSPRPPAALTNEGAPLPLLC